MGSETTVEQAPVGEKHESIERRLGVALFNRLVKELSKLGISPDVNNASMTAFREIRDSIPAGKLHDLYASMEGAASLMAKLRHGAAIGVDAVLNIVKKSLAAESPVVLLLPDNIFQVKESAQIQVEREFGKLQMKGLQAGFESARGIMQSFAGAPKPEPQRVAAAVNHMTNFK